MQSPTDGTRVGQAICPYCGVGCLLDVATQNNRITELRGAPESPVNLGLLCPKGALLGPVLGLPGRLSSFDLRELPDFMAMDA